MVRKNKVRFMAAGMLIMSVVAGCAPKEVDTGEEENHGNSERIVNIGVNDSSPDTGEKTVADEEQPQPQEDIEAVLAAYRADRQKAQSTIDGEYTLAIQPNEEDYAYGVGDTSYTARFDTKELNDAFKAAENYVRDTLQMTEVSVYSCVDPRMTAIYEESDKGVANGYDADHIFLCEYADQGIWQYLILVRDGKGAEWTVLYHGGFEQK